MSLPYDYSRCLSDGCPLASKCARNTDEGRPGYQTITLYTYDQNGCDDFIPNERKDGE